MRLLFLTPQVPFPPRQGATLRNYHLIRGLAQHHQIDLLTFLAPGDTLAADNPLHKLCGRVATVSQPRRTLGRRAWQTLSSPLPDMARRLDAQAMHDHLRAWMAELTYDIIQFEGIEMAPYLATARTVLTQTQAPTALVFDNHNCEYLLQKRNALNDLRNLRRLLGGLYSTIQWWKLRPYERWACTAATGALAVSGPDAQALRALIESGARGAPPIHVIPNGIAIESLAAQEDQRQTPANSGSESAHSERVRLVFTGKMDYRPNVDAVLWFADAVLPLIAQERPDVLFQIVGMNPHPRIMPLAKSPHIEITGAVEDVQPYIQNATVFVIPLRVGGGTRFKVLEALAARKPIVSTTLGVEGIPVCHGEHLLLADTPQEFANAVMELVTDQLVRDGTYTTMLGQNARDLVAAHYAWDTIVPSLASIYAELSQQQAGAASPHAPGGN